MVMVITEIRYAPALPKSHLPFPIHFLQREKAPTQQPIQ